MKEGLDVDLHPMMFEEHRDAYIASRLESRQEYNYGTGSLSVAMIGGVASVLRRASSRIETWSHGSADGRIQRHVSAR